MRAVLTTVLLACVCVLPMAWAQEPVGPPPDAPPAEAVEPPPGEPAPGAEGFEPPPAGQQPEEMQPRGPYVMPPQPEPAPAEPAPPEPTIEETLIDRAMAYYERLEQAPPEVAAFMAEHPAIGFVVYVIHKLRQVLIFLFLLVLVGHGGRGLLRPLFGGAAPQPEARQSARSSAPERVDRAGAIAGLTSWSLGLIIACEAVGLSWIGGLISALLGLIGMLLNAAVWLIAVLLLVGVIAWSFSGPGRRLMLSLVGYLHLRWDPNRPPQGHLFTLADGRQATIVRTDPLHSAMQPADGGATVLVPNADIMEQYYNWAAEVKHGTGETA